LNSGEAPSAMCPDVVLAFDLQKLEDFFHMDLNRLTPGLLPPFLSSVRRGKEGWREGEGGLARSDWIEGDDASFGINESFECFCVVMG